jgi:hypothetical protein
MGVAGRPTLASAVVTKVSNVVSDILSLKNRHPMPAAVANTMVNSFCVPRVIAFLL